MTRLSRLASSVIAVGLTVLPAAGFAQPTASPVQATAPAAAVAKTPAAAVPGSPPVIGKTTAGVTSQHAKVGGPAHTVPAKTSEPNKS
jgi:hypothetical protein